MEILNNWNVVERDGKTIIWNEASKSDMATIKEIEGMLGCEPFYCPDTESVVFEYSESLDLDKPLDYSQLELTARYITTEQKLYEVLESL